MNRFSVGLALVMVALLGSGCAQVAQLAGQEADKKAASDATNNHPHKDYIGKWYGYNQIPAGQEGHDNAEMQQIIKDMSEMTLILEPDNTFRFNTFLVMPLEGTWEVREDYVVATLDTSDIPRGTFEGEIPPLYFYIDPNKNLMFMPEALPGHKSGEPGVTLTKQ